MWMNQISPIIRRIWRGPFHPRFIEPGRYLFDHELVIFMEGNCQVTIEDRILQCTSGSYLIVPPNVYHLTRAGEQRVYRFCIHFDWAYNPLHDDDPPICTYHPDRPDEQRIHPRPYFVPNELFYGRVELDSPVIGLIETLSVRILTGNMVDQLAARGTLLELLVTLLAPKPSISAEKSSVRDLAYEVKQLLDDLIQPTDSIQSLLENSIGLSYAHLCRVFKRTFGMPPAAYLNNIRVEHAKYLLNDPRYNVAAVAKLVGFSDPSYFSRMFKAHVGVSPHKYARLQ